MGICGGKEISRRLNGILPRQTPGKIIEDGIDYSTADQQQNRHSKHRNANINNTSTKSEPVPFALNNFFGSVFDHNDVIKPQNMLNNNQPVRRTGACSSKLPCDGFNKTGRGKKWDLIFVVTQQGA